jgi:hypothetical protein
LSKKYQNGKNNFSNKYRVREKQFSEKCQNRKKTFRSFLPRNIRTNK